jgi:pyoverdine/dityrosine biosynthesis protein Dit1
MGFVRYTAGITREYLTRDCLRELRLWPGCETVEGLAMLMNDNGKFTVHVVEYGLAKKRIADRAIRCIQREKARRFHLKVE